jgi:hypothetical protein
VLVSLVRDELVDVQAETASEGSQTIEIIRMKITDAGRTVLEG